MPLRDGIIMREAAPNVWTFCRPFNVFGVFPVGGRSTAIKLESGGVWVFASTPLTTETKKKIGRAWRSEIHHRWQRVPSHVSWRVQESLSRSAGHRPEDLNKKKEAEGWQLDAVYSAAAPDVTHGFESEIHHCDFSGHQNKDIAFYHVASKTVIAADLLMNLPGKEQVYTASKSRHCHNI
ncbi:hypothetical protein A0H81_02597 [Grifola frondosa]|uniref:Uncharacterized protein n=1 Tax=Grifola frondosa TaxID=5627 RepID=A0A1C7MJZ7_GRIFR|nr:hypothetical protein A0H81_02597 [Grifola frondosa]